VIVIIACIGLLSYRANEKQESELSGQATGEAPQSVERADDPPDQPISLEFSMDECYTDKRRLSGKYVMKGEQSNASRAALKTQLMKLKQSKDQPAASSASPHTSSKVLSPTADIKPILSNLQTPTNPLLRSKKHAIRSTDKTALESTSPAVELLPGWMEKVDKRTSRTFYVNT